MATSKTQPALLGGLAIGVLSALPVISFVNACCCAWILFGGGLAAYLMQQNSSEPIGVGDGAVVGLYSGVVGAIVWGLLSMQLRALMAPFESQMMRRALENAADMPPVARQILESMTTGAAVGIGMIFVFFMMLCVCSFFGMLGGLFGALMFRKNPPPLPPPLP